MKAMILAAGKGTRLQPLTNTRPKALIGTRDTPMLEHQIRYLNHFGVKEIIINVHHFADQIIDFVRKKKFGCRIEFSDERGKLLNTGGGLKRASWFFDNNEPFILTGVDIYTDLDLNSLILFHKRHKPLVTLAVKKRKSSRDLLLDPDMRLCGWINNLTGEVRMACDTEQPLSPWGFSVIHIIEPSIFSLISETGAFSIMSVYLRMAERHNILGYPHNDDEWIELGRLENLNDKQMIRRVSNITRHFQ